MEEYSIYFIHSTSESGVAGRAGIAGIVVINFQNRMISFLFELEYVEFRILIPGIPLPVESQKECGLTHSGRQYLVH